MAAVVSFSDLRSIAQRVGLEVLGVAKASPKPLESSRLKLWQDKGYAAEMGYMKRDPELQSDPHRLLDGAKTIISVAVSYDYRTAPEFKVGFGRVARYAWGKDYHLLLPVKLKELVDQLQTSFGDFRYRVFADAVPFLERAFAAEAGLGFIGKNTLLIRPKLGSFTLLAEILSDIEIRDIETLLIRSNCGSCRNCLDSCPTAAFESEYVLNAKKCISYLSIEKKGALSWEERQMLGQWVFGCDVCQEVCPFNHGSLKNERLPDYEEFSPTFGVGPLLNLSEVLKIKDSKAFKLRFKDTPLLRSKREGLLRNVICVAVNTGAFELLPQLQIMSQEDDSPLLRQFSVWGFASLSIKQNGRLGQIQSQVVERSLKDQSEQVVDEAKQILNNC